MFEASAKSSSLAWNQASWVSTLHFEISLLTYTSLFNDVVIARTFWKDSYRVPMLWNFSQNGELFKEKGCFLAGSLQCFLLGSVGWSQVYAVSFSRSLSRDLNLLMTHSSRVIYLLSSFGTLLLMDCTDEKICNWLLYIGPSSAKCFSTSLTLSGKVY